MGRHVFLGLLFFSVALGWLPFAHTYGQSTYLQGNLKLVMRGSHTQFFPNQFYQLGARSEVNMGDSAIAYLKGDSVVALGRWIQYGETHVVFFPSFYTPSALYRLTYVTSDKAVFRNVQFNGVTSSARGLLLSARGNTRTIQVSGTFPIPGVPIFLGSDERQNEKDYIKDTGMSTVLKLVGRVDFVGLSRRNFIITSARSAVEDSLDRGEIRQFPIGYNTSFFMPVEIRSTGVNAPFRVTAARSYYDWNPTFVDPQDYVNGDNMRKAGVDVMWAISSPLSGASADVYFQLDKNYPQIYEPAYDKNASIVVRYVHKDNNNEGSHPSKTYWDNSSTAMNTSYSIFPSILPISNTHTLLRKNLKNFNSYTLFTFSSFIDGDMYPLSTIQPAVLWDTAYYQQNAPSTSELFWRITPPTNRVRSFNVYAATNRQFSDELLVGETPNRGTSLTLPLPDPLLNRRPVVLFYKIVPVALGASDNLLYNYKEHIVSPVVNVSPDKAKLVILNNPISSFLNELVSFVIYPRKGAEVKSVKISVLSVNAIHAMIFSKDVSPTVASDEPMELSFDPLVQHLSKGHYVLVADITYTSIATERVFSKFSIY